MKCVLAAMLLLIFILTFDKHFLMISHSLSFCYRYQDIENGIIPAAVASELRSLVKKALSVRQEIERVEAIAEGEDPDSDIDQRDVVQLIKLHQQMEKLRSRYDSLQDPVLRLASAHTNKNVENTDNLIDIMSLNSQNIC